MRVFGVWLLIVFAVSTAMVSASQRPMRHPRSGPQISEPDEEPEPPQANLVELIKTRRLKANLRGVTRHPDGSFWVVGYDGLLVHLDAELNPIATLTTNVKEPLYDIAFVDDKKGFAPKTAIGFMK